MDEFVDRVRDADLDSVRRLILFGSVARGSHAADSDVDVLAVVDDSAEDSSIDDRLRDIAYDIMLDRGTVFGIQSVTESTLEERRDHPFFQTVLAEGEPIRG